MIFLENINSQNPQAKAHNETPKPINQVDDTPNTKQINGAMQHKVDATAALSAVAMATQKDLLEFFRDVVIFKFFWIKGI